MAAKLEELSKEELEDPEILGYDAIDDDPECFYVYKGDEVNIWDALDSINEKLAPFGIAFASGCDDDYGFAKLFRIKE